MVEFTEIKLKEEGDLSDRFVKIAGKRFHYIWLYDHCLCPRCHHPSSFQKINDLSDRSIFPKSKSVQINDQQLIIDWDEDTPHRSIFPLSWLLSHAYDHQPKQEFEQEKIFWDRRWLEANPPEFSEFGINNFESWFKQLNTLGFTIIRNIDWSDLDAFVDSIGPIYYLAQYGRYSTVKAIPKGQDLSLSAEGHGLSPHTDLTFIPTTQIIQLLYCVENEASGGESMVLDGFRIAQDFRQDHPQYFEILSQTPVKFWQLYQDWNYYVSHTTPIIKLNETGTVTNIFFSHKNLGLDLPFEQVENFYEAYYAFFRYLENPAYQYCFRLQAGDCLLVQNFRILHGRKAFKPGSGSRHLEVAYMDWIYFTGKRDFYKVKHLYSEQL